MNTPALIRLLATAEIRVVGLRLAAKPLATVAWPAAWPLRVGGTAPGY